MSFQEQLQTLRKAKGLSQEKLAEIMGISRQAVAKWEIGNSYPDIAKLIALSEFFNVSIDKLVNDYEENCSLYIESSKKYSMSEVLRDFLFRVKKLRYETKDQESKESILKSYNFQYKEGNLKYIDSQMCEKNFVGEEIICKEDITIWAMNYMGKILDESLSESFLREVLCRAQKDKPYRGPIIYESGRYKYHCVINGNFDWFQGYEEIYFNNNKAYECFFHGGLL